MFVVVPVVLEASLRRNFELFEGTVIAVSHTRCVLLHHVGQVPTQPHRICLTGLAFRLCQVDEEVIISLVILDEVVVVG